VGILDHLILIQPTPILIFRLGRSANLTCSRRYRLVGALRTASGLRRIRPMSGASPHCKPCGSRACQQSISANTGCMKSLWVLPAALILAAVCHRADHRAYAAGLIASVT
jgi:hypothetical protein